MAVKWLTFFSLSILWYFQGADLQLPGCLQRVVAAVKWLTFFSLSIHWYFQGADLQLPGCLQRVVAALSPCAELWLAGGEHTARHRPWWHQKSRHHRRLRHRFIRFIQSFTQSLQKGTLCCCLFVCFAWLVVVLWCLCFVVFVCGAFKNVKITIKNKNPASFSVSPYSLLTVEHFQGHCLVGKLVYQNRCYQINDF